MSELLKNTIRFVLFILVQVFILFKMPPLHRFVAPYLYYLFILWLPFNLSRTSLTFIGFFFGLCLDYFTKTPRPPRRSLYTHRIRPPLCHRTADLPGRRR